MDNNSYAMQNAGAVTFHSMTENFRKTEFYRMNARRDDWGKPHNMWVEYSFLISSNPGDFPVFIMKSSQLPEGFANGPPKWRHFEQDCHHGHRNSNTSLGGKEEDAFSPSFRHTDKRVRDIPPPVSLSLYQDASASMRELTTGRDKETSGLRTWNCLPPQADISKHSPRLYRALTQARRAPEGKCWVQ